MPYTKAINLILVASSLMVIGSVQAQVNQQENGVIQNNRSDRAEKRSERREDRAGRREQRRENRAERKSNRAEKRSERRENRASNKGRSQRISANRASGGRRK